MPSEPEHKMEELLKTYAKKRRDDAGPSFELHPATRQLLQGEVVRLRAKSTGRFGAWLGLLAGLGPRIGFAVSVLTVLGIVLWKFYPSGEATRRPAYVMAKSDPVAPAVPGLRQTNSALPALAAERSLKSQETVQAPSPGARRVPLTVPSESAKEVLPGNETGSTRLRVLAAAPTPAAVEPAPVRLADFKDRGYAMRSVNLAPQRFKRARAEEKRDRVTTSSDQATVLSTFDFYQTGNNIRIVDADGSVYEGPVITDAGLELDRAKSLPSEQARELDAISQDRPSVRFRVSGTNRTVHQLVTLNGSFQPSIAPAAMPQPSPTQTSGSAALAAGQTPLSLTQATRDPANTPPGPVKLERPDISVIRSLPPARIQGQARIGKTEEIQIEAVPAAR